MALSCSGLTCAQIVVFCASTQFSDSAAVHLGVLVPAALLDLLHLCHRFRRVSAVVDSPSSSCVASGRALPNLCYCWPLSLGRHHLTATPSSTSVSAAPLSSAPSASLSVHQPPAPCSHQYPWLWSSIPLGACRRSPQVHVELPLHLLLGPQPCLVFTLLLLPPRWSSRRVYLVRLRPVAGWSTSCMPPFCFRTPLLVQGSGGFELGRCSCRPRCWS